MLSGYTGLQIGGRPVFQTTLVPSITNVESYQFRTDGRFLGDYRL